MPIFKVEVTYITTDNPESLQSQVIVLEASNAADAFNEVKSGLHDEGKFVRGPQLIHKISKKAAADLLTTDARFWVTI